MGPSCLSAPILTPKNAAAKIYLLIAKIDFSKGGPYKKSECL